MQASILPERMEPCGCTKKFNNKVSEIVTKSIISLKVKSFILNPIR